MTVASPRLFPEPRHLEVRGEGPPTQTRAREIATGALPDEGYELELDADGITIRYADDAGLRYAHATLDQVRDQATQRLPALHVRDHPDLAVRGYMLDISRDRVPTRATLAQIVELMAIARLNQLQLYMEHTFAYTGHEIVWRDASPMTPDDIVWLDRHCAARGIELVANQNTFGHMGRWLSHPEYRDRAHAPDGFELVPGMRMPPGVLAPTPANAAFVLDFLDELLAHVSSRRVHIGCDETFELADADAYLTHLHRIAGPLIDRGYEVLFWADVVRRRPELLAALPRGAVPVAWTYEAPRPPESWPELPRGLAAALETLGIDATFTAGFDHHVAPVARTGARFWVAPGTSTWNSLVGRLDNARANLTDAAEVARAHGAAGFLVTDWGDHGHLQPPPVSFAPLLLAGALSWGLDAHRDLDLPEVTDRFAYEHRGTGAIVEELGTLWGRTGQQAYNASPLQAALCPNQLHLVVGEPDAEAVATIVEVLDGAITTLDDPSLANAARLARHGAWRLLARAGDDAPDRDRMRADLEEAIADYEDCWHRWSRPGGLPASRAQLEATLAEYA